MPAQELQDGETPQNRARASITQPLGQMELTSHFLWAENTAASWLAPWALSPHQTLASWGFSGYEKKLSKNAFKRDGGTSLVVQWLRIHLPTQGKWVRSLVWGDPTCRRATKPMCHNHRSLCARTCAPGQGKLLWWEACAPNLKKVHMWVLVNKIFKNKYK